MREYTFYVHVILMVWLVFQHFQDIHILDGGCGTGQYTEAFISKGLGKATLLDSNPKMLSVAREKLKAAIDDRTIDTVVQAELPDLPFEDGIFDAVMYNFVLHFWMQEKETAEHFQ